MIDAFGELNSAWAKAEKAIKESEETCREAVIPSLVQLRHAGTHLLRSLSKDNARSSEEEIASAVRHCERAVFDAAEAELMVFIEEYQQFSDDYRDIQILPCFAEYLQLKSEIRAAKEILRQAPIDKNDRWKKANEALECRDRLLKLVRAMEDAREELNKCKAALQQNQKQQLEERGQQLDKAKRDLKASKGTATRAWIALAIAVPAAVLSTLGIVKIFSPSKHEDPTANPQASASTAANSSRQHPSSGAP